MISLYWVLVDVDDPLNQTTIEESWNYQENHLLNIQKKNFICTHQPLQTNVESSDSRFKTMISFTIHHIDRAVNDFRVNDLISKRDRWMNVPEKPTKASIV
jgi:hypothetical protein